MSNSAFFLGILSLASFLTAAAMVALSAVGLLPC